MKPQLIDRTDRAWFSHLVRHPVRKWSRSILTTLEPARGNTREWSCVDSRAGPDSFLG